MNLLLCMVIFYLTAARVQEVDQLRKLHACFKPPDMQLQDSDDIKNVMYTLRPRLSVVLFCVMLLTLTPTLFMITCDLRLNRPAPFAGARQQQRVG